MNKFLLFFAAICLLAVSQLMAGPEIFLASFENNQVLYFDADSGQYKGVFTKGGELDGPHGLLVRANGDLLVSSFNNNQILVYDGNTGLYRGILVSAGKGGLNGPRSMTLGPDGFLYVASARSNQVLRYNAITGEFVGVFVDKKDLSEPWGVAFGGSKFYVSSAEGNFVTCHNASTGELLSRVMDNVPHPQEVFYNNSCIWTLSGSHKAVYSYNLLDNTTKMLQTDHLEAISIAPDSSFFGFACDTREVAHYGINNALREHIATDGIVTSPRALLFRASNNFVYVSGFFGSNVLRYNSSDGSFDTAFATQNLNNPTGITFDNNGKLYVANDIVFSQGSMVRFNTDGSLDTTFNTDFTNPVTLKDPYGIIFGPDGKLYVSSTSNQVLRYNSNGFFDTTFVNLVSGPEGMTFGTDNKLYVGSGAPGLIRFNSDGSLDTSFNTVPSSAQLNRPEGVIFGTDGKIYISDSGNHKVQRFNPDGTFDTTFTDLTVIAPSGPRQISFDNNGRLYVASGRNPSSVFRYKSDGSFDTTFISDGSGGLNFAYGLSFGQGSGGNQPPVAKFTVVPTSGNVLTIFSFDGSASSDPDGSVAGYEWDFLGNNTFSPLTSFTTIGHSYGVLGTFNPVLRVTDNLGATGTANGTLVVTGNTIPLFSIVPSIGPPAGGQAVVITGSGFTSTGNSAFLGGSSLGGIAVDTSFTSLSGVTSPHPKGLVDVVVVNSNGDVGILPSGYFYGIPPTASFVFNPASPLIFDSVNGNTVNFDASASNDPDGNISSYQWDFDGNNSIDFASTNPQAVNIYHTFGNFIIKLTVTDNDGLTGIATQALRIHRRPVADFIIKPPSATVDFGQAFTFIGTPSFDPDGFPIPNFFWDIDNNGVADGPYETQGNNNSFTFTYPHSPNPLQSSYIVLLKVMDTDGAFGSVRKTVTVRVPQITILQPAAGPTVGGNVVQFIGTNLFNIQSVKFGNAMTTQFTTQNGTSVLCTVPAFNSPGTIVTTGLVNNFGKAISGLNYTYQATPPFGIIAIGPLSGPLAGGTFIRLSGGGLQAATQVKLTYHFGTTNTITTYAPVFVNPNGVEVDFNAPASTVAGLPPGVQGAVTVEITTANPPRTTTSGKQYTYKVITTGGK